MAVRNYSFYEANIITSPKKRSSGISLRISDFPCLRSEEPFPASTITPLPRELNKRSSFSEALKSSNRFICLSSQEEDDPVPSSSTAPFMRSPLPSRSKPPSHPGSSYSSRLKRKPSSNHDDFLSVTYPPGPSSPTLVLPKKSRSRPPLLPRESVANIEDKISSFKYSIQLLLDSDPLAASVSIPSLLNWLKSISLPLSSTVPNA